VSTINTNVSMTLQDAVRDVLSILTGQELNYDPDQDRFRAITKHLNRALRSNALENEWSFYHEVIRLGPLVAGSTRFNVTPDYRFRVINDDAVRFLDGDDVPVGWAYFLPRDALHKYRNRSGLWCSFTRNVLTLSRPVPLAFEGLSLELPVMREPRPFVIPTDPKEAVDQATLDQLVDFEFPDVVVGRAAWLYAQTDPMMQPRVQTLEEQYKDLMYQLIERDTAYTESPYINEFVVPVQNTIYGEPASRPWPVSNRR